MIQDNEQGEGVRAGSREQSQKAVSALRASIPDAPMDFFEIVKSAQAGLAAFKAANSTHSGEQ